MEITERTVVSLRYIMKNKEGEELENTFAGPAVQYLHGSGKILPQLEILLSGLKKGDKTQITVEIPETLHFDVRIDDIRMARPEEIEAGNPITKADNTCSPGCCC